MVFGSTVIRDLKVITLLNSNVGLGTEGNTVCAMSLCISVLAFALSVQIVNTIRFLFYRQLKTSFLYLFYFIHCF